jgi:hypothetical protein
VVAFDLDLYVVDGEFVRRQPVCEPNNPIMSNSYRIECMYNFKYISNSAAMLVV